MSATQSTGLIASPGIAELTVARKGLKHCFTTGCSRNYGGPLGVSNTPSCRGNLRTRLRVWMRGEGFVTLFFLSIFLEDYRLRDKFLDCLGGFTPSICQYTYLLTYLLHGAETFLRS